MDTYFAEKAVEAFESQDIKAYVFPKMLQEQAA